MVMLALEKWRGTYLGLVLFGTEGKACYRQVPVTVWFGLRMRVEVLCCTKGRST